jgi:hypothetical protein
MSLVNLQGDDAGRDGRPMRSRCEAQCARLPIGQQCESQQSKSEANPEDGPIRHAMTAKPAAVAAEQPTLTGLSAEQGDAYGLADE